LDHVPLDRRGIVLTAFRHLSHYPCPLFGSIFWAIWPDKEDVIDASRRVRRFIGQSARLRRGRFAKYPLGKQALPWRPS